MAIESAGDRAATPFLPGHNVPTVGRSVFEELVIVEHNGQATLDIPFPFTALLERIEAELRPHSIAGTGLARVLIPHGRSLQRDAAAPDYFESPRAVVAAIGEPPAGAGHQRTLYLKNRLFIGYQERANVLEIISYNETAGRFEFQIVRDYRHGVNPVLRYANRRLCMSCHQNAAPIFARPLWDETSANAQVAEQLAATGRDYYDFHLTRNTDIAYFLDTATDEANLFAPIQKVWSEICNVPQRQAVKDCQRALLLDALIYRLNGNRLPDHSDRANIVSSFSRRWSRRWPRGLRIPDPDIPNRNPFRVQTALEERNTRQQTQNHSPRTTIVPIRTALEPLQPREPLTHWRHDDDDGAALYLMVIRGIGQFFSANDIEWLDRALAKRRPDPDVDRLAVTDERTLLARILVEADNKSSLTAAEEIANTALQRRALMRGIANALGEPTGRWCCDDERSIAVASPVFVADASSGQSSDATTQLLARYCASCHSTPENFPPNFLFGDATERHERVNHCAERILYRLSLWRRPLRDRDRIAMPPSQILPAFGVSPVEWPTHSDLTQLRAGIQELLSDRDQYVTSDELINRPYNSLLPCLPD